MSYMELTVDEIRKIRTNSDVSLGDAIQAEVFRLKGSMVKHSRYGVLLTAEGGRQGVFGSSMGKWFTNGFMQDFQAKRIASKINS